MVLITTTNEFVSKVEAKRLWNAMIIDGHIFLPKLLPHFFSTNSFLEGDGGKGSIKHFIMAPSIKEYGELKEKVEEIDEENMIYKYSYVESGGVGTLFRSANFDVRICPLDGGGCFMRNLGSYDIIKEEIDEALSQQQNHMRNEVLTTVEDYLLSNPSLYV